jgi:hypothetical protein
VWYFPLCCYCISSVVCFQVEINTLHYWNPLWRSFNRFVCQQTCVLLSAVSVLTDFLCSYFSIHCSLLMLVYLADFWMKVYVSKLVVPTEIIFEGTYEGQYKSKASFFFLRNCSYDYNEIYLYHGYILYKVEIIFTQNIFHFQHTFSTCAWDTICQSQKLWLSIRALYICCFAVHYLL